jgi:hypothetical protein
MRLSKHASVRSRQRGFPVDCISLIINFGTPIRRPGDALEYRLRKKDKVKVINYYKHQIQLLDKAAEKAVLVSGDTAEIITVYNLD